MTKWGARWQAFRFPMDPEKQALLRARWESLPNDEKTTQLMVDILEKIGAISTMTTDSVAGGSLLPYRIAGAFAHYPGPAWRSLRRALALVVSGQIALAFARAVGTG